MSKIETWNDGDRLINQHTKQIGRVELKDGSLFIHTQNGIQAGSQRIFQLTGWTKLFEVD